MPSTITAQPHASGTMDSDYSRNSQNNGFCIEKIYCYEQKNFMYIVGSSSCKTKHRVLKIDRRYKNELVIYDNRQVFTTKELLLFRKNEGFDQSSKIEPTVAFGIVGFVRFLEGYYLILIVKRRCVALISSHCIYKIEDTCMLYIPNEEKSSPDEQRYLRIFNNVDLKSNFYFSYSYDLSNTLQYNLTPQYKCRFGEFQCGFGNSKILWDVSEDFISSNNYNMIDDHCIYIKPNMKYVWNESLLMPMRHVHSDFFLYVCHGFVSQAGLPIVGRNLIITIIARRSKMYAGTRFLKRGANCDGYPANEVETEQIVHDGNVSSFRYGLFTSFVQIRGSVPTYWSQNIAKIAPKPPINVDVKDPFYETAGKHFNNLLYNYGSPIIVLNLVKRKEKKPQESILFNEFECAIEYLNQFLPKQHQVMLIGYDMARSNKTKDANVINSLSEIALYTMKKTGFFQNRSIALNHKAYWPKTFGNESLGKMKGPIMQTGITRVNCVDCLDRTNTAQFVIGRVALAYQLYTMGVIYKPELDFETGIVQLLEELYEDHGDTLALQYGGSQLVHRIKTYRKVAPLTSQSKDIMQSLSRYYSNAFEDWDKQLAINLFLGVHKPTRSQPIWSLTSDYELHHDFIDAESLNTRGHDVSTHHRMRFTKWWSDEVALCLPRAAKEFFKFTKSSLLCDLVFVKNIENYDWFYDMHRLHENTIFVETFLFNMKKSKMVDLKKKLSNFRTQNRQSLVGIPLNTSNTTEDSDTDISDEEDDKIIIRFESDWQMMDLDISEDGNDFESRQKENKSSRDSDSLKQPSFMQALVSSRHVYERIFKQLNRNPCHIPANYPNSSFKQYYDYVQFGNEFSNLSHSCYEKLMNADAAYYINANNQPTLVKQYQKYFK